MLLDAVAADRASIPVDIEGPGDLRRIDAIPVVTGGTFEKPCVRIVGFSRT